MSLTSVPSMRLPSPTPGAERRFLNHTCCTYTSYRRATVLLVTPPEGGVCFEGSNVVQPTFGPLAPVTVWHLTEAQRCFFSSFPWTQEVLHLPVTCCPTLSTTFLFHWNILLKAWLRTGAQETPCPFLLQRPTQRWAQVTLLRGGWFLCVHRRALSP